MKREEMLKSFPNAPGICKQQCPYQGQCHHGDFCVFKEVALLLTADQEKIRYLQAQIKALRDFSKLVLDYGRHMENSCYDYYDAIYAYNGGVEKKLWIPRKRQLATKRRKRNKKLKQLRNRELMDGDPRYADPDAKRYEPVQEVIV